VSPIITIQQQLRTIGAIRIGQQVPGRGGKTRPTKLDTFRLTSDNRTLIEAAAEAFGGEVRPWQNRGRDEWEVITAVDALDIVIPPTGNPVSQWRELWTAAGCERRCDGMTMVVPEIQPCICPRDNAERVALAKEGQACRDTTRLNVMLPQLPDIGSWLLVSNGYYAAIELAGAAEILQLATAAGHIIRARLRLDQREKRIPGQPTQKYAVPVIEFTDTRLADLPLLSEQGGRPGLAPRTAVPALPSTTLPPTSDFRAPLPADEGEAGSDERPDADSGGGAPVQPEPPRSQGSGNDLPVQNGLSAADFREWLHAHDVSAKFVSGVFRIVWPGREEGVLTDVERLELQKAIDRARAGERV
jgi:hypothetical protein